MVFEYDYAIKTLLIGDSGVGKSSIMNQIVEEIFLDSYQCTIGVDYKTMYIDIMGKAVKFLIWDTAGQERFKSITKIYYRGAHVIIYVFDIGDRISFENIPRWIKETDETAPDSCLRILIGNKSDFDNKIYNIHTSEVKRVVNKKEAMELAEIYGFLGYWEVSAKTNTGINDAFFKIAEYFILNKPPNSANSPESIKIQNNYIMYKNNTNSSDVKSKCFC